MAGGWEVALGHEAAEEEIGDGIVSSVPMSSESLDGQMLGQSDMHAGFVSAPPWF